MVKKILHQFVSIFAQVEMKRNWIRIDREPGVSLQLNRLKGKRKKEEIKLS